MVPDDARSQILADFGDPFLNDLTQLIGRSYPQAFESVSDRYSNGVGHDLYPYERRARIEQQLPALRSRHAHVRVSPSMNKSANCHFHRMTANRSVLTVSKSDGPLTLPRDADFRRTLAVNPQLALFQLVPESRDKDVVEADAVYGVVIHGPDPKQSRSMAFAQILIPDASGTGILSYIDLFDRWDEDERTSEFPTVPIEPVGPTLKTGRNRASVESSS